MRIANCGFKGKNRILPQSDIYPLSHSESRLSKSAFRIPHSAIESPLLISNSCGILGDLISTPTIQDALAELLRPGLLTHGEQIANGE